MPMAESMFCVEGYVNTPELGAGRGGGISQGLPANGPYRSLFRAGSRPESHHKKTNAAAAAAAPALHVLAEAAQSPEARSPVSATASPQPTPTPAPVPTAKKCSRRPSPLISSTSPAPISATLSSPVASTNASSSSPQSHIIIDLSPPPRHPRANLGGGGSSTSGKGKQREILPPEAPGDRNGESLVRQLSGAEFHEPVQDRPRNVQKNKNRTTTLKEAGPLSQAPPAPADDLSYDHVEGDYFPPQFEAGPSGASDIACEGGHSLSPPQDIVNHCPTSARTTTSKESSLALMADSRSVTPGTKPRMITLLIEDRRHGTDELAEVHVPLKTAGEGYLWADAKDVCVALQSGPSRINGAWTRGS